VVRSKEFSLHFEGTRNRIDYMKKKDASAHLEGVESDNLMSIPDRNPYDWQYTG